MSGQNLINCKSCGAVMDVSEDPENWQLQCNPCKEADTPLPEGYDKVDDIHKVKI